MSKILLINNFFKWKNSKRDNLLIVLAKKVLGLYLSPSNTYFLESDAISLDLSIKKYPKLFKDKIFDIIFISFGNIFTLVLILSLIFDDFLGKNVNVLITIIFILFLISPLFLSWIIPFLWILKDSGIKYLDNKNNINFLSIKFRKCLLNRLLGIAGFFFAFSFFYNYNASQNISIANNLILTSYAILFFMLIMAFTSLSIGLTYLSKLHEKMVNYVRMNLALTILDIGVPEIKKLNKNYIEKVDKSYKIREPNNYPRWIILFLIIILIIIVVLCAILLLGIFPNIFYLIGGILFLLLGLILHKYFRPYLERFEKEKH